MPRICHVLAIRGGYKKTPFTYHGNTGNTHPHPIKKSQFSLFPPEKKIRPKTFSSSKCVYTPNVSLLHVCSRIHLEKRTLRRELRKEEHHAASKLAQAVQKIPTKVLMPKMRKKGDLFTLFQELCEISMNYNQFFVTSGDLEKLCPFFFWRGCKECKGMVILRDFHWIVHCLGW